MQYRYETDDAPRHVCEYISDGHGDEVLLRNNRYLADGQHMRTEVRGYNCPVDTVLTALLYDVQRARYERYTGGAREMRDGCKAVTHLQIVISFAGDERISPMERHKMMERLLMHEVVFGNRIQMADHNNTRYCHGHISLCNYEVILKKKVPTSLRIMNVLRREMDHICEEHGLSIIDNPVLRRNQEYAKWFWEVKKRGDIVIHPPREAKNVSHDDEPEAYRVSGAQKRWKKPEHPKWEVQTAGCYHYLPPWVSPRDVADESVYYPAMNMEHPILGWDLLVRYAPLYLLLEATRRQTEAYEALLALRRREGDYLRILRLRELRRCAESGLEMMRKIDVGTMADVDRHLAHVQRDIGRRRKYDEELTNKIDKAYNHEPPNEKQVKKCIKRREVNQQRIDELQQEWRQLEQLRKLCRELRDPCTWKDYSDIIVPYTPKKPQPEKRIPRKPYIRKELRYIGQLIGADLTVAEEEMWSVVQRGQPAVIKRCATVIPEVTIGIAQAMADVAKLCTTITDPYAEHDRIDTVREQLQKQMDGGALLRGMMALDTALLRYEEGPERDRIAAKVRSSVEDIYWHLQNALLQLTTAQSVSTLRIACGELALAMEDWQRFLSKYMPEINKHVKVSPEEVILPPPCPDYTQELKEQVTFDFAAALDQYRARVKRAKEKLDQRIFREYGPDPVPRSLDGRITNARNRRGQTKSTYQGKQVSKNIKHQRQ